MMSKFHKTRNAISRIVVVCLASVVIITFAGIGIYKTSFHSAETTSTSQPSNTQLTTSAPTSATAISSSTTTTIFYSSTSSTAGFISLWKALDIAYGTPPFTNYTSIPPDTTVSLTLYYFWYSNQQEVGGSNASTIAFNNVTGLPTQTVVEPYPDGVMVDTGGSGNSPSCVMYLLTWHFMPQEGGIMGGAGTWVSASTGKLYYEPQQMFLGMTCPTGNMTTSTVT
jgi:hypothetical protein